MQSLSIKFGSLQDALQEDPEGDVFPVGNQPHPLSSLYLKVSKGPLSRAHRLERAGGLGRGGVGKIGRGE